MGSVTPQLEEYPPLATLKKDIYRPYPPLPTTLPATVDSAALITAALASLAAALRANDTAQLKAAFLARQAYWRDILALTWHNRTFNDAPRIAPSLLKQAAVRGWDGAVKVAPESVRDVTVSPALRWVEAMFTFETTSPAAECGGRVVLLPEEGVDGVVSWKIWSLNTWVDGLKSFPENVDGLTAPGRELKEDVIETEVLILGGGNAGLILSARLKALGVDSVIVEKNAQAGDNWALRYDCLRFHIGRHSAETPYLHYDDSYPLILTQKELTDHMKKYAETFHLNALNSSYIEGSSFNKTTKKWTFKVRTPLGTKIVKSKILVQCTGIGGQKGFVPEIPGEYKGVNIHSDRYKNPRTLTDKGAKSVIVVGSANSAFDIMEDCAAAGLTTTIVARSPTFLFPWDYSLAPQGLGAYESLGHELTDKLQMTGPVAIGGQLTRDLQGFLADKEPNRYDALAAAGFPVYDGREGRGDLTHHIIERGGGHFNDIGDGVEMIVNGKVAVKGLVQPVSYTSTGLKFSDGSTVDADAIVWCTGFKDKDRSVTAEVLGGNKFVAGEADGDEILGPEDIAATRDAVWGVDKEGEIRGCYKRNLRLENYWIFGGTAAHHRFWSKKIALQVKAAVEGILPEAYRDAPVAV